MSGKDFYYKMTLSVQRDGHSLKFSKHLWSSRPTQLFKVFELGL